MRKAVILAPAVVFLIWLIGIRSQPIFHSERSSTPAVAIPAPPSPQARLGKDPPEPTFEAKAGQHFKGGTPSTAAETSGARVVFETDPGGLGLFVCGTLSLVTDGGSGLLQRVDSGDEIRGLAPGAYRFDFTPGKGGQFGEDMEPLTFMVKSAEEHTLRIPVPSKRRIRGRIVAESDPKPVSLNYWILDGETHCVKGAFNGGRSVNLASDGEFALPLYAAGLKPYYLHIKAEGFLPEAVDIGIVPLAGEIELPPIFLKRGMSIRGRVVDPTGYPAAKAWISVEGQDENTDENGEFLITGLPFDLTSVSGTCRVDGYPNTEWSSRIGHGAEIEDVGIIKVEEPCRLTIRFDPSLFPADMRIEDIQVTLSRDFEGQNYSWQWGMSASENENSDIYAKGTYELKVLDNDGNVICEGVAIVLAPDRPMTFVIPGPEDSK